MVRKLEEEERQAFETSMPVSPTRINTVQTGPEEPTAEWMRELPTPPFRPYIQAHCGPHAKTSGAPLLPELAGEDNLDSFQHT